MQRLKSHELYNKEDHRGAIHVIFYIYFGAIEFESKQRLMNLSLSAIFLWQAAAMGSALLEMPAIGGNAASASDSTHQFKSCRRLRAV